MNSEASVPMNDLKRLMAEESTALEEAALRVVRSGWFALGPEVEAFEAEFASFTGASFSIGTANGTDAIALALQGVGCEPGDEVVMVANAGAYGSVAALSIGAVPVFADVRTSTLLLNPEAAEEAIGPRTKAILVTHLYGNVAEMAALRTLADRYRVALVEDCAQSHGSSVGDVRTGTFGDAAAFSFYPTKNLGGLGDGGAVVTSSPLIAERVKSLRCYGWKDRYVMSLPGGRNSRLDELQAALLRVRLPYLEQRNARRREICDRYQKAAPMLNFVNGGPESTPSGHLCVIRHPKRDRVRAELGNLGIKTDCHYPLLDTDQPSMLSNQFRHLDLTQSTLACSEVLSVPLFSELTDGEVERVAAALESIQPD
jgi:dTDP-3-amino-2,3,6-trideoxy-4-keto-D-glucose/dTDP-3-amino-3,4,6-trideoxy-alpha-D-glucose/dTDP-2,6-dideoxy-D-kanosamine transaminase